MTEKELIQKNKAEMERGKEQTYAAKTYIPEVDIFEDSQALYLIADMPGVSKDQVDIILKDGILSLEGKIKSEAYQSLKPIYSEYNVGHYRREFEITDQVDQNKIEASMENGCLKLVLPKTEEVRPRQIQIR